MGLPSGGQARAQPVEQQPDDRLRLRLPTRMIVGGAEAARHEHHGGRIDIGVPDARFVAEQWVRGEIDTA